MRPLPNSFCPRFLRDIRGSVSVETVLIAPLLIWGIVSTYVFYDGFRTKSRAQVAANTVADLLSRQTAMITPEYIDDLNNVFNALSTTRGSASLRVSSVAQTAAGEDPIIAWSYGTNGLAPATELEELRSPVPPILTGEAVIVVETFGNWVPPFSLLGMESIVQLNTQIASRPRFVPWLHFEGAQLVFASYNPEWGNPDLGPSGTEPAPFLPAGSNGTPAQSGGTGTGGNSNSVAVTVPPSNATTSPQNSGTTTSGQVGGGSTLGNPNRPLMQVGLWDFDNPFNPLTDRAAISNSAILQNAPSFRQNDQGLYQNDGGFRLNNCVAGTTTNRANNTAQQYVHIPWHRDYDLTSATLRMVFKVDALPPTSNYSYTATGNRYLGMDHGASATDSPAWALFSRDALGQDENGHFTSWVMGDGALMVRYQVHNADWGTWSSYGGTNYFLSAPAGTVEPGETVDMQLTFDHELNKLDLYVNGALVDSHPSVPVTLAGNEEPWVLGAGNTHSNRHSHRTPNPGMYLCGTIYHFEIWEGAYSAQEVDLMSCGIERGSEEWYQFFYVNFGRYPLPDEGIPESANPALCSSDPNPPAPPPPPPPSDPCQPQILFLDSNNITVPFWVDITNFQVGDYITFNNIGQTPDGDTINGRVTMTARSHPELRVRMAQTGGTFLLDAMGYAELSGQTADFTLDFINQATGASVAHTGTITFSDIDRVTDSNGTATEFVGMLTSDFVSFHLANGSNVQQGASGGYTTFSGTVDTIGSDRNAWATGMFHNRSQLRFRMNARNFGTGYGLTQQAVTCGVDPSNPLPTCTETSLATQNFETLGTDNWSIPRTDHAPALGRFLGRFGPNETVTWSRTLPADTDLLQIDFDLYVLDSWDGIGHGNSGPLGERLDILVNNQLVMFKTFRLGDPSYQQMVTIAANVGGADYQIIMTPVDMNTNHGFATWNDQRWAVSMQVTNPPASFNLSFLGRTNEGVNNESWGLDNFHVRTSCDGQQQQVPTHIVTANIPFFWGDTYENWFPRPNTISAGQWDQQGFSITGGGNIQARDGQMAWGTSGNLGHGGVQLRLTTPAPGATATARMEVGAHLIQYNFVRAANP